MPRSQTSVPCARSRTASAIVTAACACLSAVPAYSQVQFNDVTNGAELTYTGESWGSSWGDVNGDKWPDLFVNHHRNRPSLYVNLANGTFEDRAFEIDEWFVTPRSDTHGGTFADYDNDGDADLVITAGSKNNSQFLVNNGAYLTDRIEDFTFDEMSWGGRLPIWFDFSHDGLLDLGITVQGAKVHLHEQVNGDFERRNSASGHNCVNNDYSQLGDLTLDGLTDWVCYEQDRYPQKVYDYAAGTPFIDQSALVNSHTYVVDSVIADFDNDGIVELFALGGRTRVSGAQATGPNSLEAHLIERGEGELTVRFRSAGDVGVELHWDARNVNDVHIGQSGVHPPAGPEGEPIRVTLSPADPQVQGIKPHNPTTEAGIYVGYEPTTQTWTYQVSHGYTYTFFDSTQPVSNVSASGLTPQDSPRVPAMLKYNSGVYTNQTAAAGLNQALNCVSVVAADFDNDMDLDLYMICRFAISNDANRLYLNDGFGVFTRLPGAGGGEGPVGLGVGLSESVTVGDYDVDGRPDLFVTNGLKLVPEVPYSHAGPDILLRNTSATGNNWIELDLVGVQSNRDAIGATITATAGGVTQTRARDGGYHRWSQNDRRLHFGLGDNAAVDVTVHWPSGTTSNYTGLAANALYELVEGNPAPVPAVLPGSTPPSACESTGAPAYAPGADNALYFWNNFCGATRYHVRATGGGLANSAFNGLIVSDQPFVNVTGVSLEGSDVLDYASDPTTISYGLQLNAGGEDGFDFTIPSGASACFGVAANTASARGGRNATTVSMPFDLESLAPCDSSQGLLSIGSVTVSEDVAGGVASVEVELDAPAASTVTVDFSTSNGSAVTPSDYLGQSGTLTFLPGDVSQTIDFPIVDDSESEMQEFFDVLLSNASNALIDAGQATVTINDDDFSSCGQPAFSQSSEHAMFVWRDCTTAQAHVRVTGGGLSAAFTGSIGSSQGFVTVTRILLESNDVLDATSDPDSISYRMNVSGNGIDGIDFESAAGASVCVDLSAPAVPVYAGADRHLVPVPFDLQTLGACGAPLAQLSVDDPSAAEDAGMLTFTVSLNAAFSEDVSFQVATADGSALVADGDYTPLSGVTFEIPAGQSSVSVPVSLGADTTEEPDETLSLTLSNPSSNAEIVDGTGTGTVLDDETVNSETPLTAWVFHQGGVSTDSNVVTYSGSPTNWVNSVNSVPLADLGFTDDFELRLTLESNPSGTVWIAGLGTVESSANWNDIEYGLRSSSGQLTVYEGGLWRTAASNLAEGDVISINVSGGTIEYRHNGAVIYTSTYSGAPDFYVDTAFKSGAVSISASVVGEADPPDPPAEVPIDSWLGAIGGLSASGNDVAYSGSPTGWNNSINSAGLASFGATGDFVVSWTIATNPAGAIWIFGLGVEESSADWRDVDFGLRNSNGQLSVYESGIWAAGGTLLAIGDLLSIHVTGTTLEYRHNGATFYSRPVSGTSSYYLDSSFKNGATNLGNFTLTN